MKYHECKVVMKMISFIALVTRPLQSVGGEGEGLMSGARGLPGWGK